jgi:flagellar biosynthetic protein FliQ
MTDTAIIEIALHTMVVALKLSTQIQEVTLSFVPKLLGVGVALLLCGNWMMHTLVTFTNDLFAGLPAMLN